MKLLYLVPLMSASATLYGSSTDILEEESTRLREQGGIPAVYGIRQENDKMNGETLFSSAEPKSGNTALEQPRSKTRNQLLAEVDRGWDRPIVSGPGLDVAGSANESEVLGRLERIFIPKVDFRELPLSKVVEALSDLAAENSTDQSSINIVLIDPQRRDPRVSIVLRRINLLRTLDFVVESVGFEYSLQPDAVVIRPRQGPGFGLETAFYPVSRSTIIRLTGIHDSGEIAAADPLGDPFAESVPEADNQLRETEASLKSFLQRAGIVFAGIEGADLALADGQLIVTQTPRNHEKLRQLLRRYREVKQVEIEARFLEVQERNLEELGIEWNLMGGNGNRISTHGRNLASAFSIGQEQRQIVIDREGLDLPRIGQGAPVLPVTVDLGEDAGSLIDINGTIEGWELDFVLRALERQSGNDLLSAPKLTVLSGKTAEIVVAEEFRYPEMYGDTEAEVGRGDSNSGSAGVAITAGTPRSFTTRNVGVEMEVTPTVEEDNSISLRLIPKVTEFEGFVEYGGTSVAIASDTTVTVPSGFYQPVFSVRRVNTEVTIWDGATVVMGGLTREHAVRVRDKVPILGDMPLLGHLFRSEGESTQKRNLMIFVTANLVSPGGSPAFQFLPGVEPNSLYQAPHMVTPGAMRERNN